MILVFCLFCLGGGCAHQEPVVSSYSFPPRNVDPPVAPSLTGSLFRPETDYFGDYQARQRGDTLSVIIQERHQLTEKDDVDLKKESKTKTSVKPKGLLGLSQYLPLAGQLSEFEGARESKHQGAVKYTQNSQFTARMTAMVVDVRPDGLLVIFGKKQLLLNGEQKVLSISGLVNPADIGADNTVLSDNIALSSIHLEGEGTLTAASHPGLASKSFQWLLDTLWPF